MRSDSDTKENCNNDKKRKKEYSKIYKINTDIEIEPFRWNKSAADLLGEMVRIIEDYTRILSMLKALVPKDLPSKGNWIWLAEIVNESITVTV